MMQRAFNYMSIMIPGWRPSEGQIDTWLIEAIAGEVADIGTMATRIPVGIYRNFGQLLIGIPPKPPLSAVVTLQFNMINDSGYTVPYGTQVVIEDSLGVSHAFITVQDLIIPGGQDYGIVMATAVVPGVDA